MAKKVLTPEEQEIKAIKKVKRGQNWTKFWAILLALVLTVGVVYLGKTTGEKMKPAAADGQSSSSAADKKTEETTMERGSDAVGEGETVTLEGGEVVVGLSKADAIKLLNDATAVAAKGSYNWKRSCDYTRNVDVGNATSTLDGIIKRIDSNSDLNKVIGNFIGIGNKEGKVSGGKFVANADGETPDDKYLLIAMALTEGDVKDFVQEANVYKFQLNTCANPKKEGAAGNNALNHATKDFITHEEVDKGIKDGLGGLSNLLSFNSSDVQFTNILITATISDGKLTKLEISYDFDATLNLKATLVPITGTGAAKTTMTYTDIA